MSWFLPSIVCTKVHLWQYNANICIWFWTLNSSFLILTGVEHLLRDVKDTTISTLATEVLLLDEAWFILLLSLFCCRRDSVFFPLFFPVVVGYWETRSFERVGCSTKRNTWLSWPCYRRKAPIKPWDSVPSTGSVCISQIFFFWPLA
jgi:hypothetical protein